MGILSSFLFPNICLGCGRVTARLNIPLCFGCEALLEHPQPSVVREVLLNAGIPSREYDCFSLWTYHQGGPVPRLHRMIKFRDAWRLGIGLGSMLGEQWGNHLPLHERNRTGTVVVPIPLHPVRLRGRGFNQAEALAIGVGAALNLEVVSNLLCRTRFQRSQIGQSRGDRLHRLVGAFQFNSDTALPERILLIDDVITTGATMSAGFQALKLAGIEKIGMASLALAPPTSTASDSLQRRASDRSPRLQVGRSSQ